MNNINTVKSLRDNGYKVRVTHVRHLISPMIVGDYNSANNGLDYFGSKREFENNPNLFKATWGQSVDSYGGFTMVEVTDKEGKTFRGKFSFGNRQFVRKIGLQAALGRALKAMSPQAETCGC